MNELYYQSIRFLLGVAIPKKDDKQYPNTKLFSAIWRAHRDALTGRFQFENYRNSENNTAIIKELYNHIDSNRTQINSKDLINLLTDNHNKIEFGAIQKLVNMTLKYIIILNQLDNDFKKQGFSVDIENCDCPLDSIILDSLKIDEVPKVSGIKWTTINQKEYNDIQSEISKLLKNKYNTNGNIRYDFIKYQTIY